MTEEMANHDKTLTHELMIEHIHQWMGEFKDGKCGPCIDHAGQLKGLWSNVNRLWWVLGLILTPLIVVGIAQALGKGK